MYKKWILLLLVIPINICFGQNPIGLPLITSYPRDVYSAGLQNRNIVQDKNGIMYFANSEGLLSFDGTFWKLYALPNKTAVRSLVIGKDGNIYAGGQNEIGYFSPDNNGKLIFKSLKPLLPEKSASFTDVWDIISYADKIFFRSQSHIFLYADKMVTAYPAVSRWLFLGFCHRQLIAQDEKNGLFQFSNGEWSALETNNPLPQNVTITGIQPLSADSVLIATQKNGLYVLADKKITAFKFKSVNPFLNQQIMCALTIDVSRFAIGTHMGGCYIVSKDGQIIQNFSRKEGLQNNTILGLFIDKDSNLWTGLDDGVDFIAYNSAIKHIYPEKMNEGAGYSAILFDKELYIGTSNWLYKLPAADTRDLSTISGEFTQVPGTKGSAWGLYSINNCLLLAHHEGAFQIFNGKIVPVNNHTGYWNFMANDNVMPSSTIVAGNYNGLDFIDSRHNSFTSLGNTKFNESARYVMVDNHTAWIAHSYKGIYKLDLSSPQVFKTKLYTTKNGLPSVLQSRVFKIKNHMVVTTEKGIYEYNSRRDAFEPSTYFLNIFKQKNLRYLKEDANGNIWFIEEKKLGVVDFSGLQPNIIYFPELNGKLVSDFENIYPLNDENIFVGAEKGFYHINFRAYKKNNSHIQVLMRMVKSSGDNDSVLYGGYDFGKQQQVHKLSNKQNFLHFEYSTPSFEKQLNIEYSYLLTNFDKGWSSWSKRTEKEYTNLSEGNYIFQVKARSNLGDESTTTSYTFIVLPPWYRTVYAYIIYAILFITFNMVFYNFLKRKFRLEKLKHAEEQQRLRYLHQLELEKSEKEIIALKNEKLESEILGKNSELASVAMHLLQKGDLLGKIKEELVNLRKVSDDVPSEELKKVIRTLNQESKIDREWDQFAEYFDNTHSDFLKEIKEIHPSLSAHELKLCAYLRMNLTSKEMAQLMNITVRGVEISRYRLRKKLQLPTEINLHVYFAGVAGLKKENASLV